MPAGHIQDIGNRQHPQPHLHKHGESYLCTALRKYLLQVIMLCQVARIRRSLCGCGGKRSYVRYLLQTEYGQPLNERACSPPRAQAPEARRIITSIGGYPRMRANPTHQHHQPCFECHTFTFKTLGASIIMSTQQGTPASIWSNSSRTSKPFGPLL